MEHLNNRVGRTLRERSQLRRDAYSTSSRSSPILPSTRSTTFINSTGWTQPVYYTESFGFNNDPKCETLAVS
ncbi:unnamed protein product [Rotaria sp. Silwood2]|nr:unnamed protein product [Rotaria sp. Silwood2]CAF4464649.1 unnamed protein product [Rotaria sp. Silwood2]